MFSFKKNKDIVYKCDNDMGSFLKSARIKSGLTQAALGEKLSVSDKVISKWENNYNFPDQSVQLELCKLLGITLEELHSGRINTTQRNKDRKETRIKLMLVSFIALLLIISIILFSRLIYYKYYYNPLSLYYIDVTNDKQVLCNIDGYYIKDRNVNILYIGNIKLLAQDIEDTDIIEVNFIHNNEIIFYASDIKNISINLDENIEPKDISIELKIKDYKTGKEKFNDTFKIDINTKDTEPNNLDYNLNSSLFINELTKMGFKKIDNDTYKKTTNTESIEYKAKQQVILINTIGDSKFTINYNIITDEVSVALISEIENEFIMTEKYSYNVRNKELKNEIGHGYTLEVVLKMLAPYTSLQKRYLEYPN